MDQAQIARAFAATVHASLHGLNELKPLLEHERQALGGRDAERVERIAGDKLALLRQLEQSVQARDRLQAAAGLGPGIEAGRRLVLAVADDALERDWNTLDALAREVASLNEDNGRMVQQAQRDARKALGILTGRSAQDDTYSTLRRRNGALASYSLGKV
jgi:flagellar biosynthesis/type III secretory pathway chaperone